MRIYTPNIEERAFLYQEAHDLETLIKDLGSLSVMVEEIAPKKGRKSPNFRVTFVLAPESVGMRVQATDRNIFDATIAAKEEAQRHLNAIVNALPRRMKPDTKSDKSRSELLH